MNIKNVRTVLITALLAAFAFFPAGCSGKTAEGSIPVVTYKDKEIYINGEFFAKSDRLYINRIDNHVISMITDDGYINLDADGNRIELSDVITDRFLYESTVTLNFNRKIMLRSAPLPVDRDKMLKDLSSYDNAMKNPFILHSDSVIITYKDNDGGLFDALSYGYDNILINQKYAPGDGIKCSRWMTGRLGYSIPELKLKEYKDHWVESSLEICGFNGGSYIWFCVRYEDESGNKTYYSTIVEKTSESGKNKYKQIYAQKVPDSFVCCNIDTFKSIMKKL